MSNTDAVVLTIGAFSLAVFISVASCVHGMRQAEVIATAMGHPDVADMIKKAE